MDFETQAINTRIIHMAADHAGFEHKEAIRDWLMSLGYDVVDHGAYEYDDEDDYPDFVVSAAQSISADTTASERAIIIGGSGQGEAILANRFPNVRAVVFNGQYYPVDGRDVPEEIITARQHNDANVLSLGARFLSITEAREAVEQFLDTDFSGEERHIRRLMKIDGTYSTQNHG